MYTYFEEKKRKNLIFTKHNIDPRLPYISIEPETGRAIEMPEGPSYWSQRSGRYRSAKEQAEFLAGGCIDKNLPTTSA